MPRPATNSPSRFQTHSVTTVPRGTVVTECSGRAQLPCDSRSARNGCHGMLMEPCSGRQPRCLKKLTKIALAHFAWPFIVATTMIPQQSITKNHCLGSTRRFHYEIGISLVWHEAEKSIKTGGGGERTERDLHLSLQAKRQSPNALPAEPNQRANQNKDAK